MTLHLETFSGLPQDWILPCSSQWLALETYARAIQKSAVDGWF